jgi:hypothetical protein
MTYEELLADIASKNYRESRTPETPYAALRAVVELHKPFKVNDIWLCECEPLEYPCPTIKAIEQELV